jgi:hypothetical protein
VQHVDTRHSQNRVEIVYRFGLFNHGITRSWALIQRVDSSRDTPTP